MDTAGGAAAGFGVQQRQRIPTDLRIAVFVRGVVHGVDAQLVVALAQRACRDGDADARFGVDGRIGAPFGDGSSGGGPGRPTLARR